jgi:hypothetical protein
VAKWLNRVTIQGARNGTTSHTIDPSAGTVLSGSTFTPTAGRLLACLVYGAVTSTTPAGWTLVTNGSAVNNGGLYLFTKTAAGGAGDAVTSTANASNYPRTFDFYEFAAGSTFVKAATSTAVAAAGGAGPSITALTGTNLICGSAGQIPGGANTSTVVWASGVEAVDTTLVFSTTDGYTYSLTYLEDSVLTSSSIAATFTGSATNVERLMFAFNVAAGPAAYPYVVLTPTPRYR